MDVDAWCEEAVEQLAAKQAHLKANYGIGRWPRYDYDLDAATATWSDATGPKVVADITVVGTTSSHDWLWAWANVHLPIQSTRDVARVREFGVQHQLGFCTSEPLEEEDLNLVGWDMTAVAVRVLGGVGAYRAPTPGGGEMFLVLRSIEFVS